MEIILYLLLTFSFVSENEGNDKLLQSQNGTQQTHQSDTGVDGNHPDLKAKLP